MIEDVGTTITLEAWDNRYKPNQDWNHAWGAAPANLIPRRLMGIRPLAPGFERILVEPQPGSLAFAEVLHPSARGPIRLRLHNRPGRELALELETPANTTTRVLLPRYGTDDATVIVDGRPTFGTLAKDRVCVDGIGSGRHTLVRSRARL